MKYGEASRLPQGSSIGVATPDVLPVQKISTTAKSLAGDLVVSIPVRPQGFFIGLHFF